jgi:hypothetical protein
MPCTRLLALSGTGGLQDLVRCLLTCGVEQAAYLCGILWDISADEGAAQQVWVDSAGMDISVDVA